MAASPQETFRDDCVSWNGYKPCNIQKANGRPDCSGCDQYEQAPSVYNIESRAFDPKMLVNVTSVGIVEMGGLGSVLRTTAVTHALRTINPGVDITWFTHERGVELLRYVPGVDPIEVGALDDKVQRDKIRSLDVMLNFELAPAAKELVPIAQYIGGFALNKQGKFSGVMPTAEYMQRLQIDDDFRKANHLSMQEILLQSVGIEGQAAQYDIVLRPDNYTAAEQILDNSFGGIRRPDQIVGLNIGTSEKGALRRWPAERHAALARQLASLFPNLGVAILNGPEDETSRQQIVEIFSDGSPNNLAVLPVVEIGNFLSILSKMRLVVTADTFGMHAARSQETPVVVLTGPMPYRELELTPIDRRIGPILDCSPCYHRCTRPIAGECMQDIQVEKVLAEVTHALSASN